jgi:hypothetical protein
MLSSSLKTAARRLSRTSPTASSSSFAATRLASPTVASSCPISTSSSLSLLSAPRFSSPRKAAVIGSQRAFSRSSPAFASIAASTPKLDDDGHISLSHIRTLAVIAHVDHGKTTLVDQLLRQSGTIEKLSETSLLASGGTGNDAGFVTRAMDSNDLEKERGITILSKCTSVNYNGHLIK